MAYLGPFCMLRIADEPFLFRRTYGYLEKPGYVNSSIG